MHTAKPLCIMTCQECGDFVVTSAKSISLFAVDEDLYALSQCPTCDEAVTNDCGLKMFESLISYDVSFFNWSDIGQSS